MSESLSNKPAVQIFDLKRKLQSNKRKKKSFALTPNEIRPLSAPWIKTSKHVHRNKIISNIPISYTTFLAHAKSDAIKTMTARNLISNEKISFKPVYFECNDKYDFRLQDLFAIQMTPANKTTTIYQGFSSSWSSQITSIPWRHNELMTLFCIYPFVEKTFYSPETKVTLADLVRESSKRQIKREYIRSLYSLLVIQDTELLMVDKQNKILINNKKLFQIKTNKENIQNLAEELKNISDSKYEDLLSVLEKFEIDFNIGALFAVEALHKHQTPDKPKNWVETKSKTKPSFKSTTFKGGHLFHAPHPHLDVENHILRSWMVLSAHQPIKTKGFKDISKTFDFESFLALVGLSNVQNKKPKLFEKYMNDIAKYWGTFELQQNSLTVKYGLDKILINRLDEQKGKEIEPIDVVDLNYGFYSDSETNTLSRSTSLKNISELYKKHLTDDTLSKICALKHIGSEKQEKFTGKVVTNLNNELPSKGGEREIELRPKGGDNTSSYVQKGEIIKPGYVQKGEIIEGPTSKRGRYCVQKGEIDDQRSNAEKDNFSLETERNKELRNSSSLTRNSSRSGAAVESEGVNEEVKMQIKKKSNESKKALLKERISGIQNFSDNRLDNLEEIKGRLFKSLESRININTIEAEIFKLESYVKNLNETHVH